MWRSTLLVRITVGTTSARGPPETAWEEVVALATAPADTVAEADGPGEGVRFGDGDIDPVGIVTPRDAVVVFDAGCCPLVTLRLLLRDRELRCSKLGSTVIPCGPKFGERRTGAWSDGLLLEMEYDAVRRTIPTPAGVPPAVLGGTVSCCADAGIEEARASVPADGAVPAAALPAAWPVATAAGEEECIMPDGE